MGATGSVGETSFQVLQEHRDKVSVEGLVSRTQGDRLWDMGRHLGAKWIGLTDEQSGERLRLAVGRGTTPQIVSGLDNVIEMIKASPANKVIGAMSGFSGLLPTLAAIDSKKDILLANKETMVAAGELVNQRARSAGVRLIPVDSEHSAIFQCLALPQPYRRIILTCSGGPFRGWSRQELEHVTVEMALKHPTWTMGNKITIDTATLMNKGLEVIEAHGLFGTAYSQIDVVIHPQSVVHSLVEFADGATMAQLGRPDMRVPVQVALSWPDRWPLAIESLPLAGSRLEFFEPDVATFPALQLARDAGVLGGLAPTVLNAANEVAVQGFLSGQLPFLRIVPIVAETLSRFANGPQSNLEVILETDRWARTVAHGLISQ